MATQVQFRGGTTSEHSTFTGVAREVTVDTTKKTVVVHDGSTAGGIPLAKESAVTSAAAITGGSINGTTVGASTASTGRFTTLTSNGATTFTANTASTSTTTGTAVITGGLGVSGRINAANFDGIVGANTAAAGAFTTGTFSGAVTLGAVSSFGTSLLHTIGGHSFVQGDANATYLYGGAGIGIQLRNSANSATLATFADSLTTYTSPVTFNAAITLGAVSSFGTSLIHTIGGHLFVQGDATTTYLYGGTGGISFRNAANTSELAIITNAGLVGIGTSSPGEILTVNGSTNGNSRIRLYNQGTDVGAIASELGFFGSGGANNLLLYGAVKTIIGSGSDITFTTNATTATKMTLDASGNLALGISSGYRTAASYTALAINGTVGALIDLYASGTRHGGMAATSAGTYVSSTTAIPLIFSTTDIERMRIDSSGNLLVGATSYTTSKFRVLQSEAEYTSRLQNSNASPVGLSLFYSGASPNGTGNSFIVAEDSTALRFEVRSNGGIANYTANNVILSDRREKTNFTPATPYLDKICAIPVQTFNYIDQNLEEDGGLTLGVVAQDVQAVAPELVSEGNWGTKEEPKMRLEIYQTDLQYALMKALQELKAEFDSYKATHP